MTIFIIKLLNICFALRSVDAKTELIKIPDDVRIANPGINSPDSGFHLVVLRIVKIQLLVAFNWSNFLCFGYWSGAFLFISGHLASRLKCLMNIYCKDHAEKPSIGIT